MDNAMLSILLLLLNVVSKNSMYRIVYVSPSMPWHPRAFCADTERKLRCPKVSAFEIVSSTMGFFYVYRHRIELDSRSISNTNRYQ